MPFSISGILTLELSGRAGEILWIDRRRREDTRQDSDRFLVYQHDDSKHGKLDFKAAKATTDIHLIDAGRAWRDQDTQC